ncbi:hypothetical protein MTQ01_00165 [Streptomyces sp. XM4193]|uniref:hypothetical protein n=1 Tax=Streptomyces sp. XM4193 TaxID=2929782 RepID=UPI001FFA3030|nr:hypothetical protein [Streptomyces sp. XM4193]MCK1794468.1 hypothetical protein [Streptomyces sp. XM4193]
MRDTDGTNDTSGTAERERGAAEGDRGTPAERERGTAAGGAGGVRPRGRRTGRGVAALWAGLGVVLLLVGGGVIAVGTGAPGLRTQTFVRISCNETDVAKGGSVWHCHGMTRAQDEAADEEQRRALHDALSAHRPDSTFHQPRERTRPTRISFVDHDGREDPTEVRATGVGSRWIAHAPGVVGTGTVLLLAGAGATAAAVLRLRRGRTAPLNRTG